MSEVLTELSKQLEAAVEQAGRSLVRVEGRPRGAASGVVWSTDGIAITAHHGLEWDEDIRVGLPDGRTVPATLVGRDPGTDLAVLKLEASGLTPAVWTQDGPRVGQIVLALSRPGRSARASLGIVSTVGEAWRTRGGGRVDLYVQSDIPLHPGFSGGLLVDAGGKGLGLSTSGLVRHAALAVPAATLKRVAEALLTQGRVRRGFLGIGTYPVPLPPALAQSLGRSAGLMLVSVQADSPASRAGLLLGDTLVSVAGEGVAHPGDLIPFLDEDRVGSELVLKALRAGALTELRLTVGERAERAKPE